MASKVTELLPSADQWKATLLATDISTAAAVPVYLTSSNDRASAPAALTLTAEDYLAVYTGQAYGRETVTTNVQIIQVFFDNQDLASAAPITGVSTTANTYTVAGDRENEFRAGRTFTVANSTGNDGGKTSTGATYSAIDDATTITVSSVTNATVDGDITSARLQQDEYTFWTSASTVESGDTPLPFPEPVTGGLGHALYAVGTRSTDSDLVFTGERRRQLTKSGPTGGR